VVFRRPRKKVLLAGFAAEAQAVMVVGDKAEFSTAACAAILRFRHETALRLEVGHAMLSSAREHGDEFVASSNFDRIGTVRLPATQRCAGGYIGKPHCRGLSAELMFCNEGSSAGRCEPSVAGYPRFAQPLGHDWSMHPGASTLP
jgi:hypothetical protein